MNPAPLKRVVVTGIGMITPVGVGTETSWKAICSGTSGITAVTKFDASNCQTKIAGEVSGFNALDYLPEKLVRQTPMFIKYAIVATQMALENSRMEITEDNAHQIGVYLGCGFGGLSTLVKTVRNHNDKGPKSVSPHFITRVIGNMAAGMVSIHFGAKGPNSSVATACAAGTHAVGQAFKIIQRGQAEVMITGGVESTMTASCLHGFNAMRALSIRNDEPSKASRPFDRDRDGFVVGEGCGILTFESLDHALARKAPIIAEMIGFGMSGDGYHLTSPPEDGAGAAACMRSALEDAGISGDAVDYINAHGTSTPLNDLYETRAIKSVFNSHAPHLAVSSTKSMTGHLFGGAGGIETAFTALAIRDDIMPPTINLMNPDAECDLDYVPNHARHKPVHVAMSNSFGFGGTNATVVLKKYVP